MRGKCAGNAFVLSFACVCCLFCLVLVCFFHFVNWATYTKLCYKCIGNEIAAGPSHRSSDTHISFSTEKQRISRALPAHFPRISRELKTHFPHIFRSHQKLITKTLQTHYQGSGTCLELAWTECLKDRGAGTSLDASNVECWKFGVAPNKTSEFHFHALYFGRPTPKDFQSGTILNIPQAARRTDHELKLCPGFTEKDWKHHHHHCRLPALAW